MKVHFFSKQASIIKSAVLVGTVDIGTLDTFFMAEKCARGL